MTPKVRSAACHPDKPLFASGKCRTCYQREYRRVNRSAVNAQEGKWVRENPLKKRRQRVKYYYGAAALKRFDELLAEQDGKCAICGKADGWSLHIDHDHVSGKIRSLLCGSCNRGVGLFQESPELMAIAQAYLEKWKRVAPSVAVVIDPSRAHRIEQRKRYANYANRKGFPTERTLPPGAIAEAKRRGDAA